MAVMALLAGSEQANAVKLSSELIVDAENQLDAELEMELEEAADET